MRTKPKLKRGERVKMKYTYVSIHTQAHILTHMIYIHLHKHTKTHTQKHNHIHTHIHTNTTTNIQKTEYTNKPHTRRHKYTQILLSIFHFYERAANRKTPVFRYSVSQLSLDSSQYSFAKLACPFVSQESLSFSNFAGFLPKSILIASASV